ncbi:MAG: DUF4192 domain-containing protein [Dactylosporangium sp.]|nr:DUF4192 domain-containing protein [Dactylosporangium sp.]NNJ62327.1 DUF4192 domain-containing protein [Dactylosporangium sp.]
MDDITSTRWSITSPADLLVAVPYLLGFHPDDGDAVWVAFRHQRLRWMGATGLPDPGTDPAQIRAVVAAIVARFAELHATSIMMVGYGPPEQVTPLADAVRAVAEQTGITIGDLLRLTGNRYHSYQCGNPACCPPEGRILDPDASPIAAQATLAGLVAFPDRRQYLGQVAPITGSARQAMTRATARARSRLDQELDTHRETPADTIITNLGQSAIHAAVADPNRWPLPDDEAAWLTLLLAHDGVRDLAWSHSNGHPEHLALWLDLTRRTEPDLLGNTAGLCALSAFQQGKDILARAALDRIVHDDPTHPLATVATTGIDERLIGTDPQDLTQTTDG